MFFCSELQSKQLEMIRFFFLFVVQGSWVITEPILFESLGISSTRFPPGRQRDEPSAPQQRGAFSSSVFGFGFRQFDSPA